MTVSDHVFSFAGTAALPVFVGAVVAAAAFPAVVAAAGAVAASAGTAEFKPRSALAGALTSTAAVAFAAWHFGGPPAELPAEPTASAPETTLIAEGKCKDIQTRFTGKDGARIEFILPPGCALKPAP